MALLPVAVALWRKDPRLLLAAAVCAVGAAEAGRRRGNGASSFSASSALWAPAWLAERAVTSWLAFGARLLFGGVRYRNTRLKNAATPSRLLQAKLREQRTEPPDAVGKS